MNVARLYEIFLNSTGICIDSRKTIPGSIFFALKGEKVDGNKFALEALQKGCMHAVVDDPSMAGNRNFTIASDTLEALQQLAVYHRNRLNIPVIAITGSNGKTTTKELCYHILTRKFNVLATQGNLNNHIGVPITLLSIKNEDFAIIEMGANHEGEIGSLCSFARPDFGLITNIGLAHLEGFKSPEGILRGKAELYDFLRKNNGHAFYNASSSVLSELITTKQVNPIPFGDHPSSVCNGKIIGNERFLKVQLQFTGEKIDVSTHLVGNYNLENIIAASAVGKYFGVTSRDIKDAIENYYPSNNRSQFLTTITNKIILDAYNANPSSMNSSILNFYSLKDQIEKVLILGDMLELGGFEDNEHLKILDLIKEKGFNEVYLVGPRFSRINVQQHFRCFEKVEDLIEYFSKNKIENRLILMKGSRGIKLEKILDSL